MTPHLTLILASFLTTACLHGVYAVDASITGRLHPNFAGTFFGIAANGSLYFWGDPLQYRYAGEGKPILAPQLLLDEGPWKQVGGGTEAACALHQNGSAYCWGEATWGELGNGVLEQETTTPVAVSGGLKFDKISVGLYFACGITTDGRLFCWGDGDFGQLGDGQKQPSAVPVEVAGGATDWVDVSAGSSHVCSLKSDATLHCWGENAGHEVSPSNTAEVVTPTQVPGEWATVSAGSGNTIAVAVNGTAYGWGLKEIVTYDYADGGYFADNETMCYDPVEKEFCPVNNLDGYLKLQETPAVVAAGYKWSYISAGRQPCGIEAGTGKLFCWGYSTGEAAIPEGPSANYPVEVAPNATLPWVAIEVSGAGKCGIQADGSGYCWGRGSFDCEDECGMGDGTSSNRGKPTKVINVDSWLPSESTSMNDTAALEPAAPPQPASDDEENESGVPLGGTVLPIKAEIAGPTNSEQGAQPPAPETLISGACARGAPRIVLLGFVVTIMALGAVCGG